MDIKVLAHNVDFSSQSINVVGDEKPLKYVREVGVVQPWKEVFVYLVVLYLNKIFHVDFSSQPGNQCGDK